MKPDTNVRDQLCTCTDRMKSLPDWQRDAFGGVNYCDWCKRVERNRQRLISRMLIQSGYMGSITGAEKEAMDRD